jgi:peptidoglycan/xylan/chitin deacetylase (PgdA/CDA1 family)
MTALLRQAWQAAAVSDLLATSDCPTRRFGVTFDDGYASTARFALRTLTELGIPATVFVVAGAIGGRNVWDERRGDRMEPMLSLQELRQMIAQGLEIGSHGMTHALLTETSAAQLKGEVFDSKKVLEDLLGRPVAGFSYPYGVWDARVREAVVQAGYQYAVVTALSVVTPSVDRFAIPRINVRWNAAGPLFWWKIGRAFRAAGGGEHARP